MISTNNTGWVKIHRKILDSELWLMKPISWKLIWLYILMSVNHEPKAGFERGEGYFNFSVERDLIGKEITKDQIKSFLKYAKGPPQGKLQENTLLYAKEPMITTKRTTRGTRIKVLNYNIYQMDDRDVNSYRNSKETLRKLQGTTPINKKLRSKEDKKGINSDETSQGVKDFKLEEYIKKMEDNKRRDLNIIALYLEQKKPDLQNLDQLRVALKRHLRPAKDLVNFSNAQILDAIPKAKKLTDGWTLETVVKVLTK
jgi:hypothetical protein